MEYFGYFRSIYLRGIFEYFDSKGIQYKRSQHYLKHFELARTESDVFLPSEKVLKWIDDISEKYQEYCISYLAASKMNLDTFSLTTKQNCAQVNDLEAAIVIFANSIRNEEALLRMWVTLDETGRSYRVHIDRIMPSMQKHHIHAEWVHVWWMIKIVQSFLGERWLPSEIGFQSFNALCKQAKSDLLSSRIVLGNKSSYIMIERRFFSEEPFANVSVDELGVAFIDKRNKSVKDHLKVMLAYHLSYKNCCIESCAAMLDMSVRTFQRKLQDEGTNFRQVVMEFRVNKAKSLLKRTDSPVGRISDRLGYSAATHFIRSFKNEVGQTPEQYRAQFR